MKASIEEAFVHLREIVYALTTLPDLMHEVQTRTRLLAPLTRARTGRRFTFQRRRLTLCAWLMAFPNCGPLPQISHTWAMMTLQKFNSEGLGRTSER